ncbi:lipoprotein signal peptidase [Neolewinella lacunae]|uniref:Lipoprotein signal peptidase n=1 Tax=Neolewinella lacunae TaxID=1517758 RepID=A0A923TAM0_9BACT|nr:lipoprotein signal peptidase [Neolewinella lacunae]MBC6996328.1 lipoprotein signal peptidase [Neolewinella lacunae]MDN3636951.1 lipoprotein signal peptidase [Neolewinella lacunae]
MKRERIVFLTLLLVLLADQASKIWVKTHLAYGEEIRIFGSSHLLIHFVENNGMAFGISLGGDYGKLLLTLFRIVAVVFLGMYLRRAVQSGEDRQLLFGFSLVLAGAIGNIIDSVFYGRIFSESSFHGDVATLFPPEGGYAPLLYGRVVDMFYFPLFYGNYPDWLPWLGGKAFVFFRPVFNVADVAISLGVVLLLWYYFGSVLRNRPAAAAPGDSADQEAEEE